MSSGPRPLAPGLYATVLIPPASEVGDRQALLSALAETFSPRYELPGAHLVTLDLRGLERMFGTPRAIGEALVHEAAGRGVRAHVAIAATQVATRLLARSRPGLTVVAAGGEAAMLASAPIGLLEKLETSGAAPPPVAVLRQWGLRTLGAFAALPAAEVAARLGAAGLHWQAVAQGRDVRPLVPAVAEERFEGGLELEWPIEGLEALAFVLTRLLEPLSTRLERRDRGAAALHVTLRLTTKDEHHCRLELPTPMRDVRALRTLVLLDLEAHPPAAGIDRVTLVIEPTPGRIVQHALFTRPQPTPEQLSTLLARLQALMGQSRVGAPQTVDSHRPGAFTMVPFALERPPQKKIHHRADLSPQPPTSSLQSPVLVSALRRYRQPVPARVAVDAAGRPVRVTTDRRSPVGGAVQHCAGPWRTSGEWWSAFAASPLRRDESVFAASPLRRDESAFAASPLRRDMQELDSDTCLHRRNPEGADTCLHRRSAESADRCLHRRSAEGADRCLHRRSAEGADRCLHRRSAEGAEAWDHDEWDVALSDEGMYRIFRDRVTDGWFIEAVVD